MSITAEQLTDQIQRSEQVLATADLSSFLHDVARPLVLQSVRDHFNSSVSPGGQQWTPRKEIGDGHPLLMESGALLQAATGGGPGHISRIAPREMAVGVEPSIEYAAIHNYGGVTRPMPQREYMGADDATEEAIGEELADFLLPLAFGG